MPGFADVKAILDTIKKKHPNWDDVQIIHTADGSHMEHAIDWQTKDQLTQAVVWRYEGANPQPVPYPLIDVSGGKTSADTYLIRALSGGFSKKVDQGSYPRMPYGGPVITPDQIKLIAAWIDAGMPD